MLENWTAPWELDKKVIDTLNKDAGPIKDELQFPLAISSLERVLSALISEAEHGKAMKLKDVPSGFKFTTDDVLYTPTQGPCKFFMALSGESNALACLQCGQVWIDFPELEIKEYFGRIVIRTGH